MKKLLMLLACLFYASVAFGQVECADCGKDRFGSNVCLFHENCKCMCQILAGNECLTFLGPCIHDMCVEAAKAAPQSAEAQQAEQQAYRIAHPWIADPNITNNVEASSSSMAAALRVLQKANIDNRWSDASGVLAPDKANPSARVTFELIERTNGRDEIRLDNELTKQHETMMFITGKKKWYLFRSVPTPDHPNNQETVTSGDIL